MTHGIEEKVFLLYQILLLLIFFLLLLIFNKVLGVETQGLCAAKTISLARQEQRQKICPVKEISSSIILHFFFVATSIITKSTAIAIFPARQDLAYTLRPHKQCNGPEWFHEAKPERSNA
jgi:hypothetical protein